MICQMIRLSMESEHGNTMEIFIKESKDFFGKRTGPPDASNDWDV